MNNDYLEETTPDISRDYENDQLVNLLSCVGLGNVIASFHAHQIYTLEDFLSCDREEILSYGFIDNNDYDNLVAIFNEAVALLRENKNVSVEEYRESIIESKYTQRLRISISKQSFYDGNDNDSEHRDSLLEENRNDYYDSSKYSYNESHTYKDDSHENDSQSNDSNYKHSFDNDYSYSNEVSIDEALQWNMRRQPNVQKARHTVDVSNYHSSYSRQPTTPTPFPRFTTYKPSTSTSSTSFQILPSISETSFCEGMEEISGGVYEDCNLSNGKIEVYIVSQKIHSWFRKSDNYLHYEPKSTASPQIHPTTFQYDQVIENENLSSLVYFLSTQLSSKFTRLFDGYSFTCCLYGSLLSPAYSLFLNCNTNEEETYEDSFSMDDDMSIPSNSSMLQQFGELILDQATQHGWKCGISAFLIQDNSVFDLLKQKEKRNVIDSGSILFIKNITCYIVKQRMDIHSIIQTIKFNESAQPCSGHITVVFQLITPNGEYVSRMTCILLAPCDKVIPVEDNQPRGLSKIQYKKNADVTSALMTLSRVLTPSVRQPFRDNKLTLYLRPFLFHTDILLIGCLPPFDDSISSIPSIYMKKTITRPTEVKSRYNTVNQPVKNTENFISIIRYCYSIYMNNHKSNNRVISHKVTTTTTPIRKNHPVMETPKNFQDNSHAGVEFHNAFIATTKSIDQDISTLREKIANYMTTYNRELTTSKYNNTISFFNSFFILLVLL